MRNKSKKNMNSHKNVSKMNNQKGGEMVGRKIGDYIVIICRMTGYDEEDIYEYLENSFEELVWVYL